jgi:hypothetical protein
MVGRRISGLSAGALLLSVAASGCGGSDDAPAKGGSGGTVGNSDGGNATDAERAACLAWCEAQADTGCPGVPSRAECPARCAALPRDPECGTEYVATTACVARGDLFVCGGNRVRIEATSCFPEIQPFLVCAICRPTPEDDACDSCERNTCCAEYKAYVGHPDFTAASECGRACQEQDGGLDLDCFTGCTARFTDFGQTISAMTACRERCSATCR